MKTLFFVSAPELLLFLFDVWGVWGVRVLLVQGGPLQNRFTNNQLMDFWRENKKAREGKKLDNLCQQTVAIVRITHEPHKDVYIDV